MKKTYLAVLAVVVTFVLSGCSTPALSDKFTEEQVSDFGSKVVELVSSRDYDAVNQLVRPDITEALSADVLAENVDPRLDQAGAFVDYKSITVFGDKEDESVATVVLVCNYENKKITYTISIDDQEQIIGFYIK